MIMDEMTQEEWERHIKSVVIENMKTCLEGLSQSTLPDPFFNLFIRGLEGGLEFLKMERR